MRKTLLASTILAALPIVAYAQTIQSGTIGGMPYQVLMPSTPCTTASPCGIVTYLGYQDASYQDATIALMDYFGGDTSLHAIVIAPTITAPQDSVTDWGGYDKTDTPQQDQMVAVVQGVEAQMGNTVNPAASVVTGGSLGGNGTQASLIDYGPKGVAQPGVFSAGVSFDAATYSAAGNAQAIAALCGVPLMAVHGTADTNQSVTYDQSLQSAIDSNPACNNSFTFVPVDGAGHGTWGGPAGYNAGIGAGTSLGTIAADLQNTSWPVATSPGAATTLPKGASSPPATATPASSGTPPAAAASTPAPAAASKPGTTAATASSSNGTVKINLSAPVTMSGGNNSLLVGFPWGGGNQQTLAGNGEGEVYEASGITQNANGSVTLTAQPNSNTSAAWPNNLPYTSGGFSTASVNNGMPQAGGFTALYGYFQMTAELPSGAGLWPAFWLEPVNGTSACEIDVFEAPFNNPTLIQDSLHDGGTGYTTGQVTVPNYSTNYNTYGLNWSPTTITYYVNGQEVGSTPTPASCNTPAFILANLAVGGQSWAWPGTPNSSNTWPANMTIQSIIYNPNGPSGVGSDGGTFSGGLAVGTASATATSPSGSPGSSQTGAATPAGGTIAPAAATPTASAPQQITPSGGSVTDCSGNTWAITADFRIEENGVLVPGGGDSSALTISGCTVYGLSNGENGSKTGWFTMSTVDPTGDQFWNFIGAAPASWSTQAATQTDPTTAAAAPAATPATTDPPATGAPPAVATSAPAPIAVQSCPAGSIAASGGFHVAGGQIIGPDGKAWIARGVDVHDGNLSVAAEQIPTQFPGTNLVRVDVDPLSPPQSYASAVSSLTARGTVVEFSDYTNSLGTGGGGGQGVVFTGALLANELAWFSSMASYYKDNTYVWLGTNNEPATVGGSLSDWQLATYQAIRNTGNKNPIFLEVSGSRPPGYGGIPIQSGMNPADYTGMTNVIWDPHVYGYQSNYSTDPATIAAEIVAMVTASQTIQSADGLVPVVIGEYGPEGSNGMQTVQGVISAGATGTTGSAAWVWDTQGTVGGPGGDPTGTIYGGLLSGGQLTAYGQMVQLYVNTNVVPMTNCQETAQAQQAINTAAASLQTPATTTATQQ